MVESLARAAEQLGAIVVENARVDHVAWSERGGELRFAGGKLRARKILIATNAFSLEVSNMHGRAHPKLTLAAMTAPIGEEQIERSGLSPNESRFTQSISPICGDASALTIRSCGARDWSAQKIGSVEHIDIAAGESARMFASLERRIRHLRPGFDDLTFTHLWGGPILFRDNWTPVFYRHPESATASCSGHSRGTASRYRFTLEPGPARFYWGAATCQSGGK